VFARIFGLVIISVCSLSSCSNDSIELTSQVVKSPVAVPDNPITTFVSDGSTTYFADLSGFTLYYLNPDAQVECDVSCEFVWNPYLVKFLPDDIDTSRFGLVQTDKGTQLTLDGKKLYTYSGDENTGQLTGNGSGDAWVAAKE